MSDRHENLLRAIFHDPVGRDPLRAEIHWREIESLLHHLGATLEPLSGAKFRAKLNGVEEVLNRPYQSGTLDRSSVKHVREFLAHAQVTPAMYEQRNATIH